MNGKVELITQAEYARRRDVAKSAVARAVREKRITLINGKIDPAVADIQWEKNTRARADSGAASTQATQSEGGGTSSAPGGPAAPPAAQHDDYKDYRTRRERADAEMAERANLKDAGLLVERSRVERGIFDVGRAMRDAVMSVGPRAAPKCVSLSDARDIEHVITEEVRKALQDFEVRMLERLPAKDTP